MSKNFWKMTTVGLIGYMIGKESVYRPMPYDKYSVRKLIDRFRQDVRDKLQEKKDVEKIRPLMHDYVESVRFPSKEHAHIAIDSLQDTIDTHGYVTLYDFMKLTDQYAYIEDYKQYRWYDLDGVVPFMDYNGSWKLNMPYPKEAL